MIGVNICDTRVQPLNVFCTVRELNNSIDPVHLISVSVFEDRRVDVKWAMSAEPKFKEFEIYKYPITGSMGSIPEFIKNDTTLSDSSFNVDKQAFCYQIIVVDKCGHISKPSNKGCNVIITGSSVEAPDYYFNLKWADYIGWDSGVSTWDLQRKNDIEPFKSIVIQNNRFFKDDKLDYDWGGYWYRAIGYEASTKGIYYKGITESNWVYLYQPPEVWVPNAFTVNNDKLNDFLVPLPVGIQQFDFFKVYNRFGQLVFSTVEVGKGWDGKIGGKEQSSATFVWYVQGTDYKGVKIFKKGTSTLIK
jgi:gliding motility-associated-like protein